ncbi:rRNA methyltransferase, putative [Plasmodium yoelii]|nr:rRNA methyltransferase, putative [Plasmodium yoelii]CDU16342.1 apicoplast RNA methyltransferase precursor, putative [Plasmodium yoelii]VTZ72641.1 rRNA methyltransferase, putative [Plasmodium yoelii]|eukprot:XP_728972.2 rRNA methyltransferase, putative [Plasmodium yoelii]
MQKKYTKHFVLFFFLTINKFVIKNDHNISRTNLDRVSIPRNKKKYKLLNLYNDRKKNILTNIKRNSFLDIQNKNDIDYIYGLNSVYSVLKKNERKIDKAIINKNAKRNKKIHKEAYDYILNTIKEKNIQIVYKTKNEMDELVGGFPHNDIIIEATYRYMKNYRHFINNKKTTNNNNNNNNNIFICLHNVYDNMNVGNICRSILFFGGDSIFLKRKKKKGEHKNYIKIDTPILHSSVGASEYLNFFHVNNMENFISSLKEKGFTILSTSSPKNNTRMTNFVELKNMKINKNEKVMIILGNESKGLSEDIIKNSDICIYINNLYDEKNIQPNLKNINDNLIVNSLNVNNVCSIILHHFQSNIL